MPRNTQKAHAYIVGGGIAGLSAATFLVRDGQMKGQNIHILEETALLGGSLDSTGNNQTGYTMRGGRMYEGRFGCTYDLLDSIPSIDDPQKSVKTEIFDFFATTSWNSKSRLIQKNAVIANAAEMGFNRQDRKDMMKMMRISEKALGTKRIQDVFNPHFFETNFWFMWCTMFAFEIWHSAVEMKRYMLRFIHLFPTINTMKAINLTRYNQYDSMIRPMTAWLKERGVDFRTETKVTDVDLAHAGEQATARSLAVQVKGQAQSLELKEDDFVIITNGSMTAGSSLGSMKAAPVLNRTSRGGSWELWETIAPKHPGLGNPSAFTANIDESKWESFTVTTSSPLLKEYVEKFTQNPLGRAALLTFKESNWLMTINFYHNPRSLGQEKNTFVWWGYGLLGDKVGNFVPKKMCDCTGEEIMIEALGHLGIKEGKEAIIASSTCIPCIMPYITSQFMPRAIGDRPQVIPANTTNLAFIGQYAEVKDDTVFTVEYSVRTAMTAAYHLAGVKRRVIPMYQGKYNPLVLFRAWRTMHQ